MSSIRMFPRRSVDFNVNVTLSNHKNRVFKAKDISQGGMYLATEGAEQPFMGELLHINIDKDLFVNEVISHQDAVVVRKRRNGFGLSFIGMED